MNHLPAPEQDIYAYQRDELLTNLKSLAVRHQPLEANGETLLRPDDVVVVLQKIRHRHYFSRKEKHALAAAGFDVDRLFPNQ